MVGIDGDGWVILVVESANDDDSANNEDDMMTLTCVSFICAFRRRNTVTGMCVRVISRDNQRNQVAEGRSSPATPPHSYSDN